MTLFFIAIRSYCRIYLLADTTVWMDFNLIVLLINDVALCNKVY